MKNYDHMISRMVFLIVFTTIIANIYAVSPDTTEYHVKAAYLYNFAKFVEWDKETLQSDSETIVIGILGKDPFGKILDNMVAGKQVRGKPLVVRRLQSAEIPDDIHMLFISKSEKKHLPWILKHAQLQANVLTIADMPDFVHLGGMINLFMEENKVRFEVNVDEVNEHHLKLSSKLLNLARIIKN